MIGAWCLVVVFGGGDSGVVFGGGDSCVVFGEW